MNDITKPTSATQQVEKTLLQPDNHNKKYESLFVEIDNGSIKLPMFQREFVWEKEQSSKLIDSILKGYPIGTFIFWKTREELRSYKEVGNHTLPETPKGDSVQYILDGQQRITSLYAIRKGIRITKDGKEVDYRDIFINLDHDPENDDQIVVTEKQQGKRYISVHKALTSQVTDLLDDYPDKKTLKLIETYKNRLTNYDFSTITINDYPIEVACEVFSRINTGGKALTVFEIMVAKTYDEVKCFDLAEKYELLRDGSDEEKDCLAAAKFETLPESIVMQCVAAITLRAVKGKDILKIRREIFINNWNPMRSALFTAIDFIRSELRIPVSQLVPYPALLIPLTYFFHITGNKKPSNTQVRLLEQFFYWAGLTLRYSSSSDSKVSEDFNKMDSIAKSLMPNYPESELFTSQKTIQNTQFSTGNAYCKTILCLFTYQQPKSFDTNGAIIIDNSNLKISASRNYHHFFPKAYLKKFANEKESNLIANITLIDAFSNQRRIGKEAPSKYIKEFISENDYLSETLKTHLISNIDSYGIFADDYDKFIERRAKAISQALNVKLMSLTPDQN